MTHYDAIIIGSGLGGLAAAAKLTLGGFKARVLEKHVQPGGYATTFSRGRFEFEVSLHALTGVRGPESTDPSIPQLNELQVAQQLEFVRMPDLYRTTAPGLDLRVPRGREPSLDALIAAFPHERRGLRRIYDQLWAIKSDVRAIGSGTGEPPTTLDALRKYPVLSHASAVPLSHLIYREVEDPLTRLAIGQVWSYFGLPPSQLSLLYFAIAYTTLAELGASYPKGKSQAISNAFVRVIEKAGGEVSLGNGAERILVENGRVTGVLTEAGEHLETGRVISNANPFITFFDLVGAEHVDSGYLRKLTAMQPSMSTVSVYLGLDASPASLGLEDHEVFINNTIDMDRQYESAARLEAPDSYLLTAYSVEMPEFSPPGTTAITLTAATDGRIWRDLSPGRYHEVKQRYADGMLDTANEFYPGLRDHVEVAVVSTPLTNMRYTGNQDGAIYGFAQTPAQCPAFRLGSNGVVGGLWLAGAWTQPGGGYEPVIESGRQAAIAVIGELEAAGSSVAASARRTP